MPASDMIARVSGFVTFLSALWNMVLAFIWFLMLVWVLVGVMWAAVGLAAVAIAVGSVFTMVRGHHVGVAVVPVCALGVNMFNLNLMGGGLDFVALILAVLAYVLRAQESAAAS